MEQLRRIPVPNRGPHLEARAFAALHPLAYVIRSAEFASVDGVLDCTIHPTSSAVASFAERFFALTRRVGATSPADASNSVALVSFDVKSRASPRAQDQTYLTSSDQRRHAAFYICFCAADPSFVEVVPNGLAGEDGLGDGAKSVAVNRSGEALVEPLAYHFLSPCNSLYRMPVELLPEALASIRACALGEDARYVNPWTKVCFRSWKPLVSHSLGRLVPDPNVQPAQFTAYEGTARIWYAILNARARYGIDMRFDFVLHQPMLADFKLITAAGTALVQYKIDFRRRVRRPDLRVVEVARVRSGGVGKEKVVGYYFNALERFDYLLYEFQMPQEGHRAKPDQWETWCFFLPERVLPDRFYTTTLTNDSFTDDAFRPYWLHVDPRGEWVSKVHAIIQANPDPRRPGDRPLRELPDGHEGSGGDESVDDQGSPPPRELGWFHQQFFRAVMDRCARRRSGLLVILARGHPLGDFAYCRYRWSDDERETYARTGWPPCTIHDLPARTPVVPVSVFARRRSGTTRGPSLTAAEVRRLSSCAAPRIMCFDAFGSMGRGKPCPLLVVPSDDVSLTTAHRTRYEQVLATNKAEEFTDRVPRLAEQLHTGLAPADYTVAACGPAIFDPSYDAWTEVCTLLDDFSSTSDFHFPEAVLRQPQRYQISLQDVHQCLADEYEQLEHRYLQRPHVRDA